MKTATQKGTVSDKIAASTVLIQDNPITNLDILRNLVSMVKVGKKKECIVVIGKDFNNISHYYLGYLFFRYINRTISHLPIKTKFKTKILWSTTAHTTWTNLFW